MAGARDRRRDRAARQLFGFSILYLFLLFAVIVAENGVASGAVSHGSGLIMSDPQRQNDSCAAHAAAAEEPQVAHIAIGLAVAALVVIFYALTIVKLGPGILQRPL